MNLKKMYKEEDLFPREIASVEEREYGYLFYDEENRESYDSNHAVIFRKQIKDLDGVLTEIVKFYKDKGMKAIIYQSISDEGYFEEIKDALSEHGFDSWTEEQRYMVLSAENVIRANPEVSVQRVSEWKDEYGTEIFEKAEARNIGVGRAIVNCFVQYCKEKQVKDNFLWPDGDTPEKIYYEAGYRYVETKNAGRAVYR